MENVTQKNEKSISGAIKIDEKEIGDHLNQLVRQSVEDTINSLLDAKADAGKSYFNLFRIYRLSTYPYGNDAECGTTAADQNVSSFRAGTPGNANRGNQM